MNNFAFVWKTSFGWSVISGSAFGAKRFDFGYESKHELFSDSKWHCGRTSADCLDALVRNKSILICSSIAEGPAWMKLAIQQLNDYFEGKRIKFGIKLDTDGTEFQKRVWDETSKIKYGHTVSYGELASIADSPGAARAVGAAMGANPIPVIVPCHRVIGADGSLHGFAMGLDVKKKLLDLEKTVIN